MPYEGWHFEDWHDVLMRERDEARAIARRLAAASREEAAKGTSATFKRMCEELDTFDALLWSKEK